VRFKRSAFTNDQLEKLKPFVDKVSNTFTSHFIAIWQIYFSFLTCEIKYSAAALNITDRQNTYSMTLAVKGIIRLFKIVNRKQELYRKILAFLFSYNHQTVRIYGYYLIINREKTTFYCHPIYEFSFTILDSKEK